MFLTLVISICLSSVYGQSGVPPVGSEYNDKANDGSYRFGFQTGDQGAHYHAAVASRENQVAGRFGSRDPASGKVVETQYTSGKRGFRAKGPNIARKMDLSQNKIPYNPPVVPNSPDYNPTLDGYHDPNESPAYSFGFKTPTYTRNENADSRGHVDGAYSFIDDVGERHDVIYEAGAKQGFNVKTPFPDSKPFTGLFYRGPPSKPGGKTVRGKTSIQQRGDGSYRFVSAGPDQRRTEVSDASGNVRGSYSYVDDKGQQRTVQYIAGPNIGYRIVNKGIGPKFPPAAPFLPSSGYPDYPSVFDPLNPDFPVEVPIFNGKDDDNNGNKRPNNGNKRPNNGNKRPNNGGDSSGSFGDSEDDLFGGGGNGDNGDNGLDEGNTQNTFGPGSTYKPGSSTFGQGSSTGGSTFGQGSSSEGSTFGQGSSSGGSTFGPGSTFGQGSSSGGSTFGPGSTFGQGSSTFGSGGSSPSGTFGQGSSTFGPGGSSSSSTFRPGSSTFGSTTSTDNFSGSTTPFSNRPDGFESTTTSPFEGYPSGRPSPGSPAFPTQIPGDLPNNCCGKPSTTNRPSTPGQMYFPSHIFPEDDPNRPKRPLIPFGEDFLGKPYQALPPKKPGQYRPLKQAKRPQNYGQDSAFLSSNRDYSTSVPIRAHVQSLDISPYGSRIPSPSFALEHDLNNK